LTEHLYTPTDLRKVRLKLLEQQEFEDLCTGLPLEVKDSVTDHCHDSQYVRGILSRQINTFIGKAENNYKRMIPWWCNIPLPELLRLIAAYLEREDDTTYLHPSWIKSCKVHFNKLSESEKAQALKLMKQPEGKNGKERKEIFRKALLSRKYKYKEVLSLIAGASSK
jgi:Recombination endonuclease VII